MLGEMATILLAERDLTTTPKKVGADWVTSFLKRNPDIEVKFARRLTYSRALCEDPWLLDAFLSGCYST
jgi:hypothetical protein